MHTEHARQPVVVVADDFGMSTKVNSGILSAFSDGLITNASLMANMPAFEAAAETGRDAIVGRLGVHLNLSEGAALSPQLRRCPRFCAADGTLIWEHRQVWRLDAEEKVGIAAEWRAQIAAVVARGVRPTHVDSHHHVHTAWPLGALVISLAREFDIRAVRLSRTCGPVPEPSVRLYKRAFNHMIRRAGLSVVAHFGSVQDVQGILTSTRGPVEVMTHPVRTADGRVVDHPGGSLAEAIGGLGVSDLLTTHRDLARSRTRR